AFVLIACWLVRPGCIWTKVCPPSGHAPGAQLRDIAETAPAGAQQRVWIEGEDFDGDPVAKGVLLPLGEPGNARERLSRIGLRVLPQGEELQVLMVQFGSQAAKLGVEQGWRITRVETPVDRPAKEWMYIPALLLVGLVAWLQRRRMTKRPGAASHNPVTA